MAGEMDNKFNTTAPRLVTKTGDNILYPFSPPIFQSEVHSNFIKDLIDEGKKLTVDDNDYRDKLAGVMRYGGSYRYTKEFTQKCEKYLLNYITRWFDKLDENFGGLNVSDLLSVQKVPGIKETGNFILESIWINYQKKYDTNPLHNHNGKISFVIYCKVPSEIFDEIPITNSQNSGQIIFHHGEHFDLTAYNYMVRPYENLLLMFPSKLNHSVPPFWTDSERISVSGNFVVV